MAEFYAPTISPWHVPNRNGLTRLGRKLTCSLCEFVSFRYRSFDEHFAANHLCQHCWEAVPSLADQDHQCQQQQQWGQGHAHAIPIDWSFDAGTFQITNIRHEGTIVQFNKSFTDQTELEDVVSVFANSIYQDGGELIMRLIQQFIGIKLKVTLNVTLVKNSTGEYKTRSYYTPYMRYLYPSSRIIQNNIVTASNYLQISLNLNAQDGSDWSIDSFNFMQLDVVQYQPLAENRQLGGGKYIATPAALKRKGLINIYTDRQCFILSVVASLYRKNTRLPGFENFEHESLNRKQLERLRRGWKNPEIWQPYLHNAIKNGDLNMKHEWFNEVTIDMVYEFEELNQIGITIFEYNVHEKCINIIKTPEAEYNRNVDLLLLTENSFDKTGTTLQRNGHFVAVPDVKTLLKNAVSRSLTVCRFCLKRLDPLKMPSHLQKCFELTGATRIAFPNDNFYNFDLKYMTEDVGYKGLFDFIYQSDGSNPAKMYPVGYTIVIVKPDGSEHHTETYLGENPVQKFIEAVLYWTGVIDAVVSGTNKKVQMSEVEWAQHFCTQNCEMCDCTLTNDSTSSRRVLHHNHLLNRDVRPYKTLCQGCNTKIRQRHLVWICHFGNKLHFSHILGALDRKTMSRFTPIGPIEGNIAGLIIKGRHPTFIIDSSTFLSGSIPILVNRHKSRILKEGAQQTFPLLWNHIAQSKSIAHEVEQETLRWLDFDIATQAARQVNRTSCLHFAENLINQQTTHNSLVSQEDILLWRDKFNNPSHDQLVREYMKARLFALASILQHFVEFCMQHFSISPLHSATLASYSYNLFMANTEETFEFISDPKIIQLGNDNNRGGINICNKHHHVANSERLGPTNILQPPSEILYCDVVSTFASKLHEFLPIDSYQFLNPEELSQIHIEKLQEDTGIGYYFLVDLEVPEEMHEILSDLPPAPTHRAVNELFNDQPNRIKTVQDHKILTCDFLPKLNYFCYYKNLKYYLKKGCKLVNVKEALRFRESRWLAGVAEKLVNLRQIAKSQDDEILADFIKSIYSMFVGKCLTSSKNYVNVVPVCSRTNALYHAAKPTFCDYLPVSPEASYFLMKNPTTFYNKPLLVGLTVQELSKLHLYQGFDEIQRVFGKVELISGNTDSLCLAVNISGQEYLNKLSQLAAMFDFSNMIHNGSQFTDFNRDKPGCWKIIADKITEFVAIGPCTYSYVSQDSTKQSGKGISKLVLAKMKHADFTRGSEQNHRNTYSYSTFVTHRQNVYSAQRHVTPFHSIQQNRVFDGNTSLPFGHFKLNLASLENYYIANFDLSLL